MLNQNTIGVVLCGGKSTRMGSDKGLLSINSERWFEKGFNLLSIFFSKVVISIHPNQFGSYSKIRPELQYIEDETGISKGPLSGILSVHNKFPESDLFVLATDMIKMNYLIIKSILNQYEMKPSHDVYLYKNGKFLEPLSALYTRNGLNQISRKSLVESNYTLHKLISDCDSLLISEDAANAEYFSNMNRVNDL